MFDLNNCMDVTSEKDFDSVRIKIYNLKKQFPMFRSDVNRIENIIESHIKNYSNLLVCYRQTKKKNYLEQADKEIKAIANTIKIAEKMELMALLAQR